MQQLQQPQQHRKSCGAALQQQQNYYSNCDGDEDIFEIERSKGIGGERGADGVECGAKTSQSFPVNLCGAAGGSSVPVSHHYANLQNSEVRV